MGLLLLFAGIALSVSFLCSILEAVLLSVTPSFIGALQQEKKVAGDRLYRLKEDVDRPLAAILSVNTIANTVGAVGVGAQAQRIFDDVAVAIASALLTLAILFFSEIIPKTLGATHWRRLAPFVARVLPFLILISWPLVWLAKHLMSALSSDEAPTGLSREEMSAMTEIGAREGVVAAGESRLVQSILRFGDLRVHDIMTPRTVVLAVDEETTVQEFFEEHPNPIFSRIPVYREELDEVTGYVLKNDLLLQMARDNFDCKLKEQRRDIVFVPEYQPVRELFELVVGEQQHIAMVVDEYGGVAGVVTMEDVVETLLGLEIMDESDIEQDMRAVAREQWLKRARRMGFATEDFPDVPAGFQAAESIEMRPGDGGSDED
ncbi:MAG: hemolysin family protein [Bradymonadaceae bacterium]